MAVTIIETNTDYDVLYATSVADLTTNARPGSMLTLAASGVRALYVQTAATTSNSWRRVADVESSGVIGLRSISAPVIGGATAIYPVYFPIAVSVTSISVMVGVAYNSGGNNITVNVGPQSGGSYFSGGAFDVETVSAGGRPSIPLATTPVSIAAGTLVAITVASDSPINAGSGLTIDIQSE